MRVRVCAAHMGGFSVQNSLNRSPFLGRFSLNMDGFSRNRKKWSKMGSFPQKFILKVGMTATVGN